MSYYYSPSDIRNMIAAGIISDPNKKPDYSTLAFISKQHQCSQCGGEVEYQPLNSNKRKKKDPYHFVCKQCGHTEKDAPLKKK